MKKHYDIGIYGWWGHENFGGCLTYFALHETLKNMGYSVLMIQEALGVSSIRYKISDNCIAMRFANKHYNCSPQVDYKELPQFNELCDCFFVGGDQLWNNHIPFVSEDDFLNWVDDNKRKLSYSTSFGQTTHNPPIELREKYSKLLRRYNAISVRENYAPDLAKNLYGVEATEIIDAVFLPDREVYENVTKEATISFDKKYLLAFILNPIPEKRNVIEAIAEKLGIDEIVCIPDAAAAYHKSMNEVFEGHNIVKDLSIENFLYAYSNAAYIVTDSFHGTCMATVFQKPFSVFYNAVRGADRFISLQNMLKLDAREVKKTDTKDDIFNNENVSFDIDYTVTNKNISEQTAFAFDWLKSALQKPVTELVKTDEEKINELNRLFELHKKKIDNFNKNQDFVNIRILATLLRDYGIKDIVISPGGRDVPIVRIFEMNDNVFKIYAVTDERSAGYYALGLATKLRRPVAMVCTSGTAASNYMPAVTEAYYTNVPIIAITADRYPMYVNQGEDQTIPQVGMFDKVIKKSCTLSISGGKLSDWETRRNISECLLECTRNIQGPVHINVPVSNIFVGADLNRTHWTLLPKIFPHLQRVSRSNPVSEWLRWVKALKESKRILIVYGQNFPANEKQLENIEKFASKYNCVIDADHLSNLDCRYCVHPFNMLRTVTRKEFYEELVPDILITVGGKRIMNDPLTELIRNSPKLVRHWDVAPGGKVKDFYFCESSILDCSQDWFFEWFANNAGDVNNDNVYYSKWETRTQNVQLPMLKTFSTNYILNSLLPKIPEKSFIHLAVGMTFVSSQKYQLNKNVEVFCNMGTNGIDGCTSTFMGQVAASNDKELAFLCVGDLSFFYDMNGVWNKKLKGNIRIILFNNGGTGLLRDHRLKAISSEHNAVAKGWVESLGFKYLTAKTIDEFNALLPMFVSKDVNEPIFFETFCGKW